VEYLLAVSHGALLIMALYAMLWALLQWVPDACRACLNMCRRQGTPSHIPERNDTIEMAVQEAAVVQGADGGEGIHGVIETGGTTA